MFPARLADEIRAALIDPADSTDTADPADPTDTADPAGSAGARATATPSRASIVAGLRTDIDAAHIPIERPYRTDRGDFSSPIALQWTSNPAATGRKLAHLLADRLRAVDGVACCDVAGPGFLNVRLDSGALADIAANVVAAGEAFGVPAEAHGAGQRARGETSLDLGLIHEAQWAHVRMVGALRAGVALGAWPDVAAGSSGSAELAAAARLDLAADVLVAGETRRLVCALAEFPDVVRRSERVQRAFGRYVAELAALVADFEGAATILPRGEEEPNRQHRTRLVVVCAARAVIGNALRLWGQTPRNRL